MKTLILMRHAKSSWADPGTGDHDRPLNKRGRAAAPVMARWLEERGLRPGKVLSSSARRARETAALMREAVPALPEPEVSDALFHATPGALRQHLTRLPDACDCALFIGHEPGLSSFLQQLGGCAAAPDCQRAYSHYPTAAIAVLEADIGEWPEFRANTAEFVAFAVPGELMKNPA